MNDVELHSNGNMVTDVEEWEQGKTEELRTPLSVLQEVMNADIFVVSGEMQRSLADNTLDMLNNMENKRPNCVVFLSTAGGDPDAAYIIARAFQNHYERFSVYLSGYCKSAGTLLVLGADEVVMSEKCELGPLDVQLRRDDNLAHYLSGLDIATSISKLGDEAYLIFEETFLRIIASSGGTITTKTAADIAVQLSTGVVSRLAEQLDVLKFVESARSMDIAIQYGLRLGAPRDVVYSLATRYPSHSFVIDYKEVAKLFAETRVYDEIERLAESQIQHMLRETQGAECIRHPHEVSIIVKLDIDSDVNKKETEEQKEETESYVQHSE